MTEQEPSGRAEQYAQLMQEGPFLGEDDDVIPVDGQLTDGQVRVQELQAETQAPAAIETSQEQEN